MRAKKVLKKVRVLLKMTWHFFDVGSILANISEKEFKYCTYTKIGLNLLQWRQEPLSFNGGNMWFQSDHIKRFALYQ